jgi:hypothetical protein
MHIEISIASLIRLQHRFKTQDFYFKKFPEVGDWFQMCVEARGYRHSCWGVRWRETERDVEIGKTENSSSSIFSTSKLSSSSSVNPREISLHRQKLPCKRWNERGGWDQQRSLHKNLFSVQNQNDVISLQARYDKIVIAVCFSLLKQWLLVTLLLHTKLKITQLSLGS